MERKTLGGDRLGAGNKMKVEGRTFERSTFNKSKIWYNTQAPGTLVPFLSDVCTPGDTWDIELDAVVMTLPTIGPLFGSFKLQLDVFTVPLRLYNRQLHNNKVNIGLTMEKVKFPIVTLEAQYAEEKPGIDVDNMQINPSCIFRYLGIKGIGMPSEAGGNEERDFCAHPILSYYDIYKNFYANKQEKIGAIVHTPPQELQTDIEQILIDGVELRQFPTTIPINVPGEVIFEFQYTSPQNLDQVILQTTIGNIPASQIGTLITAGPSAATYTFDFTRWGPRTFLNWYYIDARELPASPPKVQTFPLEEIDNMREAILGAPNATPFSINNSAGAPGAALQPWSFILEKSTQFQAIQQTQEGLALKTYQSDQFNNWLNEEFITGSTGVNDITRVDTSEGYFTIDSLILANKTYNMLNRIAVSGGTVEDYYEAVYDVEQMKKAETPVYQGGLSKEVVFQEVVSNSESPVNEGGSQPLGTLAGKGRMSSKHKGGRLSIRVNEPSMIMGLVSLTPRICYSQGNDWHVNLTNMRDLHVPDLDQIGFQDLLTSRMAWWATYWDNAAQKWVTPAVGKQPAWLDYQTTVNESYGNFAIKNNQMFMTLNRQYTPEREGDKYNIDDITTYIDPAKYNTIFAQTSIDSMNFWVQVAMDIEVRRKMSSRIMPIL